MNQKPTGGLPGIGGMGRAAIAALNNVAAKSHVRGA